MENQLTKEESHLRKLIRRIVREELAEYVEATSRGSSTVPNKQAKKQECAHINQAIEKESHLDRSWAVFGSPQPDKNKGFQKQERPRALPGWTEPYRPEFDDFGSPPFLARKPF